MPDEYEAHAKLAKKTEAMGCTSYFATGEHEYTRWGFNALIDAGVGLIQPDVMWMGSPTEFARVVALASAKGVQVVPHGCGTGEYGSDCNKLRRGPGIREVGNGCNSEGSMRVSCNFPLLSIRMPGCFESLIFSTNRGLSVSNVV